MPLLVSVSLTRPTSKKSFLVLRGTGDMLVRHGVHARVAQFEDLQKTDIAAYLAAASPYGQHGKPLAELDAGKVFKSAQRYNRNAAEIQTAHERLSGFFSGFAPGVAAEEIAEREPSQMMVGEGTEENILVHLSSSIWSIFCNIEVPA